MGVPFVPGHEGAGIVASSGCRRQSRAKLAITSSSAGRQRADSASPCRLGTPLLCDRLEKTTFRNKLPTGDTRLHAKGQDVAPFLGTACFASHTVVPQEGLVPVSDEVPFEALAAVGCAVVTGVGAVSNAAKIPSGAVVAVIGAGGVGLNVVQGAVLAGASRVIAIDREAAPLAVASSLGATDIVQPTGKTSEAVRALTNGRGADYVFDTVGTPCNSHGCNYFRAKGRHGRAHRIVPNRRPGRHPHVPVRDAGEATHRLRVRVR